jgi:4-carboxymuconolactone decarboxylase
MAQIRPSTPADIDPESRNRLPIVARDTLDELGRTLYDKTADDVRTGRSLAGFQGPNGITLYSSRVADPDQRKNDYLRFESRLGRRLYELAILVTARELDHQFEWAAHEPAARKAGVEPAVIEVVKRRQPISGLAPKDAAVIQLGREVFAQRRVHSDTFAEALRLFGPTDLVDLVSVMGHYSAIAVLLTAFDQQLAPGQVPLLPAR